MGNAPSAEDAHVGRPFKARPDIPAKASSRHTHAWEQERWALVLALGSTVVRIRWSSAGPCCLGGLRIAGFERSISASERAQASSLPGVRGTDLLPFCPRLDRV